MSKYIIQKNIIHFEKDRKTRDYRSQLINRLPWNGGEKVSGLFGIRFFSINFSQFKNNCLLLWRAWTKKINVFFLVPSEADFFRAGSICLKIRYFFNFLISIIHGSQCIFNKQNTEAYSISSLSSKNIQKRFIFPI